MLRTNVLGCEAYMCGSGLKNNSDFYEGGSPLAIGRPTRDSNIVCLIAKASGKVISTWNILIFFTSINRIQHIDELTTSLKFIGMKLFSLNHYKRQNLSCERNIYTGPI